VLAPPASILAERGGATIQQKRGTGGGQRKESMSRCACSVWSTPHGPSRLELRFMPQFLR